MDAHSIMETLSIGEIAMVVLYVNGIVGLENLPFRDKFSSLLTEFDDVGRPSMDVQTAYWFEGYATERLEEYDED